MGVPDLERFLDGNVPLTILSFDRASAFWDVFASLGEGFSRGSPEAAIIAVAFCFLSCIEGPGSIAGALPSCCTPLRSSVPVSEVPSVCNLLLKSPSIDGGGFAVKTWAEGEGMMDGGGCIGRRNGDSF